MDPQSPSTHPPHPVRGDAKPPSPVGPKGGSVPPGPAPGAATDPENSLDALFSATRAYRQSREFLRLLRFMRRFPQYSPFNCFLLHVQNPEVSLVATAGQWQSRFKRRVRPEARPLVILAPMSPVLFVFDLEDTEGDPLPPGLENPFETRGRMSGRVWKKTIANCLSLGIELKRPEMPGLKAGQVTLVDGPEKASPQSQRHSGKFRILVNGGLSPAAQYATLVHELAHIWCGHLGPPPKKPSLDRRNLELPVREFEAEAVSYLVCGRRGLETSSAKYLAGYVRRETELPPISLHAVLWAAHKIEEMGDRFPPKEKPRP